ANSTLRSQTPPSALRASQNSWRPWAMPFDAPANGPDWSVSTPSVMVSSVTPGPVSSAVALASPLSAVTDGSSALVEQAAATTTRTAADPTRAWRRTSGTELLDMGSSWKV